LKSIFTGKLSWLIPLVLTQAGIFFAMPGQNIGWLVWVAFIPQLWQLRSWEGNWRKRHWTVLWLVTFMRWAALLWWFHPVAWAAVGVLAMAFAALEMLWWRSLVRCLGRLDRPASLFKWLLVPGLALAWAAVEELRTLIGISGFSLSLSQWQLPQTLWICSWAGASALSACIVAVNLVLYMTLRFALRKHWQEAGLALFVITLLPLFSLFFSRELESSETPSSHLRLMAVQPYQPAYREWTRENVQESVDTLFDLSGQAALEAFDWMLWGEGTLPWPMEKGGEVAHAVESWVADSLRRPLLMGNTAVVNQRHVNGVLCLRPDSGLDPEVYAKQALVPFGEFIPGRRWWPWIQTVVPIAEDFAAGNGAVLFDLPHPDGKNILRVAPLVCYEDCIPRLSVQAARAGADLLYVATYNVWYGEGAGAYVHAAHSVLRSAETGLPVLRCGSAGWSGAIHARGRSVTPLQQDGTVYFRGYGSFSLPLPAQRVTTVWVAHHEGILGLILVFGLGLLLATGPAHALLIKACRSRLSR
jgi:apolipoprotein N-acyltransferase